MNTTYRSSRAPSIRPRLRLLLQTDTSWFLPPALDDGGNHLDYQPSRQDTAALSTPAASISPRA
jgi:hypothetical protein